MTIEALKLKLIKKISVCENPQTLSAIMQLLDHSKENVVIENQQRNPLVDVLLGQKSSSNTAVSDSDLKDLQDSIDNVFLKK